MSAIQRRDNLLSFFLYFFTLFRILRSGIYTTYAPEVFRLCLGSLSVCVWMMKDTSTILLIFSTKKVDIHTKSLRLFFGCLIFSNRKVDISTKELLTVLGCLSGVASQELARDSLGGEREGQATFEKEENQTHSILSRAYLLGSQLVTEFSYT